MPINGVLTQADKRRTQNMTDQHGREYSTQVEKATGQPTGGIQYLFDVPDARLYPPQQYMIFDPTNSARLKIDYDRWASDMEAAATEWEENRIRISHMMPGVTYDPAQPPPLAVLTLLGPRPAGAAPILAMKQGNAWALGFSKVKPPEARRFFPDPLLASTAPVFSGETWANPVPPEASQTPTLAEALAELETRCPANVTGAAKTAWMMREMKKLAGAVTTEAEV